MLDAIKQREMLRQMILVRAFEEKLDELYQRKAMFGSTHSYRGQEAIAVGVCAALESTDLVASYHRGTGHSKGRGGKMHMGDMAFGFLGNTGTVGGTVPTATGAALSAKIRGSKEVVVSFFGDGAANQGVVHEAMNLAGVWKLPVIYVCENNQYAMTVSLEKSVAIKHLSERAAAYGFEGKTIDGNDVEAVYDAAQAAAAKARSGGGATFLECVTYRWDGHFGGDPGTGYRSNEEIEAWKQKCPIKHFKEKMIQEGNLTEEEFAKISSAIQAELDEIAKRAEAAPLPKKEVELSSIYAVTEVARG